MKLRTRKVVRERDRQIRSDITVLLVTEAPRRAADGETCTANHEPGT